MKYLVIFLFLVLLLGCQTVKENNINTLGEFFDALGSGDLKFLKKHKKAKEVDDGSWEEVDNEKEGTE
tara:strand:- start:142 stop:345 length:204 start_codon:yes stop_codon:yes gene_type:complete